MIVKFPKVLVTKTKIARDRLRFVIKNDILQFIRCSAVMNIQRSVIIRYLIHDLTKHVKRRDGSTIILVQTAPVTKVALTKYERTVNVRSYDRANIHTVL